MAAMTQSRAFIGQTIAVARRVAGRRMLSYTAPRAAFELPPLPYAMDALEPKMSKTTFEFHYGKHHAAYLNNLNGQIKGKDLESMSLEEVMLKTWNGGKPTPEFNNAAQVINHTFFWESMGPNKGGEPSGKLADAIQRDFGSFDAFKDAFKTAGATQFGSGWAWLSTDKSGKLEVTKTPNAENPWVHGKTPILTMDVWEHAYYLDVQNRRPDYMTTFFDLINWDKVAERYAAAVKQTLDVHGRADIAESKPRLPKHPWWAGTFCWYSYGVKPAAPRGNPDYAATVGSKLEMKDMEARLTEKLTKNKEDLTKEIGKVAISHAKIFAGATALGTFGAALLAILRSPGSFVGS